MRIFYRIIWLSFVFLTSNAALAETQCTNDGLLRSVSVIYPVQGQPLPCEVRYDKPAENQSMTLWRAENQAGFCEAQAQRFVARLQDLGWSCAPHPDSDAQDGE
ncbi:MAG: hypothetical protein ACFHXK_06890 [bacterium]